MDNRAEEHASSGPAMDVVELLISVSRSEKKRQNGVLGCEEEDNRELGEGKETGSVGIGDENGILGDTDEHSGEVSGYKNHC